MLFCVFVGIVIRQLYLVLLDADVSLLEQLAKRWRLLLAWGPRLLRHLLLDFAHRSLSVWSIGRLLLDERRGPILRLILNYVEVIDLHLGRLKLLDLVGHV